MKYFVLASTILSTIAGGILYTLIKKTDQNPQIDTNNTEFSTTERKPLYVCK